MRLVTGHQKNRHRKRNVLRLHQVKSQTMTDRFIKKESTLDDEAKREEQSQLLGVQADVRIVKLPPGKRVSRPIDSSLFAWWAYERARFVSMNRKATSHRC